MKLGNSRSTSANTLCNSAFIKQNHVTSNHLAEPGRSVVHQNCSGYNHDHEQDEELEVEKMYVDRTTKSRQYLAE